MSQKRNSQCFTFYCKEHLFKLFQKLQLTRNAEDMFFSMLQNLLLKSSLLACGDADAEPGARMTCRLLLHLFRAPQACLLPQATGEMTVEIYLMTFSFGALGLT